MSCQQQGCIFCNTVEKQKDKLFIIPFMESMKNIQIHRD